MKIDFLIGENPYGTTIHFAKGMARALESLGAHVRLFWVGEGHFFHAFYAILADPPDLTCSFSDISLNFEPLGELWQIPHLSLFLDPPLYSLHQLKGDYSLVSCVDQKDCAFIQKCGFDRCFFLPHGVEAHLKTEINEERPYDAVFFGTCIDYKALEEKWKESEREILKTAVQRVLSPEGISIAEALIELGIAQEDFARFHDTVDLYIRGKDRVELIRSLKGRTVHIWGDGPWEKYFPKGALHPAVDFEETFKIMRASKLVLNSSPRFKAGAHERIFYALMCGSAVYTGENEYIQQILPEMPKYRYGLWEEPSLINLSALASYGQNSVLKSHTFQSRAEVLLSYLNGKWYNKSLKLSC